MLAICPSLHPSTLTTSELSHAFPNPAYLIFVGRYNYRWSRHTQDAISTVLLTAWIGGMATATAPGELGRLLTLEQVGDIFQGAFQTLWIL
jgi:hypothetical protein